MVTNVTTEELLKSADLLEEKIGEYRNQYEKMYSEIENLRVAYKGQSSDAFNAKIQEFRASLEEMNTIVNSYISFLRNTSSKYVANEEALAENANNLR